MKLNEIQVVDNLSHPRQNITDVWAIHPRQNITDVWAMSNS